MVLALFLYPGFLVGTFVVLVPLILHLLRRRLGRPLPLPSLFFIRPLTESTRSHWFRRWLVLLLRCLAIALLAAAFARPFWSQASMGRSATVVVIDHSFSMQAKGRWEKLKAWAREQVGTATRDESVGILLADPHPRWLAPLGGDASAALKALAQATPGWESIRVEPALRMAADVLAASPYQKRRLIFMGDHQQLSWAGTDFAKKLPACIEVVFSDPSPSVKSQVALADPKVNRTASGQLRVQATIVSFSATSQQRKVSIFADGVGLPLGQQEVKLAPREEKRVELELPTGVGPTWVKISSDPDDLPADDMAYALVPPKPKANQVSVAIDENPQERGFDYLAAAFQATRDLPPGVELHRLTGDESRGDSVTIVRNALSFSGESGRKLETKLHEGGQVLLFLSEEMVSTDWWQKHGIRLSELPTGPEPWLIRDWAVDHPLVAAMTQKGLRELMGWEFRRGWALPKEVFIPIAYWNNDTVAVGELRVGNGRMIVCGFSCDRRGGDWPVEPSFLPFVHRTVAQLLSVAEEAPSTPSFRVGEAIALPTGKGTLTILAGPAAGGPGRETEGAFIPESPGIYEFAQGAIRTLWAVNLALEESDLSRWPQGAPWGQLASRSAGDEAAEQKNKRFLADEDAEQKSGFWWWCMVGVATVLLLELPLANRTVR